MSIMDVTPVRLYILENEGGTALYTRLSCEGVANLGQFRAFLDSKSIIPWPFQFYDAEEKRRIDTELEQISELVCFAHKVTVIRSDDRQAIETNRKRVDEESMALLEPTNVKEVNLPVACDLTSAAPPEERNEPDETSCPELEPSKHKVFLSHSGKQKPFVRNLCKLLEQHTHYPFFDQREDSLPRGKKFAELIIKAAKTCRVAVVVLSNEYLSSKWPMIELEKFVWARESGNKNIFLLPLFYKASVADLDDPSIKNKWMPKWIEFAQADPRVVPEKWAEAVRELRGAHGIKFCRSKDKDEDQDVDSYCGEIVEAIFRLAAPDFLHDMSNIYGRDRICKILANKFQPHPKTSASVLGLYGMGGLGKTTISKCLSNHFAQEFLGRVCYIEMKEGMDALERQKLVMRKLLRLVHSMMEEISDASQGQGILKIRIKENPIFLVIDNVQPGEEEEARNYLNIGYNSLSKILVVSRTLDVVGKVLGDQSYCCKIPDLKREEGIGILLHHGGKNLELYSLSRDERAIVEGFVEETRFGDYNVRYTASSHVDGGGQYHPLVLQQLGAYLEERSGSDGVLSWDTYLYEYRKLKGSGECYDKLFTILGLQFNTLDKTKKLMYLDIVLYAPSALASPLLSNSRLEDMEIWLANIHGVEREVVKIAYLRLIAMLNIEGEEINIHDLYKEYAKWALKHDLNNRELVSAWHNDFYRVWNLNEDIPYSTIPEELRRWPSGTCWQELKRIQLKAISFRGFDMRRFQEWRNVVVLQLIRCEHVISLNLEGFTCIRHLELRFLENLQTLILIKNESTSNDTVPQDCFLEPKLCSPRPWLQCVVLEGLTSLNHLPSFSPFTSMKYLEVVNCGELREPPTVQHCVHLRRMQLDWFPKQTNLPNLNGLTSLRDLTIRGHLVERGHKALKLEGLSSLESLGALELRNIPLGDLDGLEKLLNVEFINVHGIYLLEHLPQLKKLGRSSLHLLDVDVSDEHIPRLENFKWLINEKLKRLRAQRKCAPHFPNKIGPSSGLELGHNVFLSHSGKQKHFVDQLYKLLKLHNHNPFFDQIEGILLQREDLALILKAIETCRVVVVVLSEEYLTSKWSMMILANFFSARKFENMSLCIPVFYGASFADLVDLDKWMPKWIELAQADPQVDPEKWAEALRGLCAYRGLEFCGFENKDAISYGLNTIVEGISRLTPPYRLYPLYDLSSVHDGDGICKILVDKFQQHPEISASVLGLYGMRGAGKTIISKCLYNHFREEFSGKVCHIEMKDGTNALERQQIVMRKLLNFVRPIMYNASQGWDIMEVFMRAYPVFLIIENIRPHDYKETLEYLKIKYNSRSRIMVVSKSFEVVEKLLGGRRYCYDLEEDEEMGI